MEAATRNMFAPSEGQGLTPLSPNSNDEAMRTGLSLILADAARSHLKSGDLDKANLCLAEAERWMDSLSDA